MKLRIKTSNRCFQAIVFLIYHVNKYSWKQRGEKMNIICFEMEQKIFNKTVKTTRFLKLGPTWRRPWISIASVFSLEWLRERESRNSRISDFNFWISTSWDSLSFLTSDSYRSRSNSLHKNCTHKIPYLDRSITLFVSHFPKLNILFASYVLNLLQLLLFISDSNKFIIVLRNVMSKTFSLHFKFSSLESISEFKYTNKQTNI